MDASELEHELDSRGLSQVWHSFDEFQPRQVHDLLKLRQDIFVVEQNCAYPDIDGKDPDALHCLFLQEDTGAIGAALRVFLPKKDGDAARIGRVIVASSQRGTGLGKILMQAGMVHLAEICPGVAIALSAQAHLTAFYGGLGFKAVSDTYLEDGIPHVDMLYSG